MVGLVIASHSAKLAEGVKELAAQMAGEDLKIIPAGGLAGGAIGTDAVRIGQAIQKADSGDGVVVLADLGSAVLSTQTALELLAAVTASAGSPLNEVVGEAERSRDLKKL